MLDFAFKLGVSISRTRLTASPESIIFVLPTQNAMRFIAPDVYRRANIYASKFQINNMIARNENAAHDAEIEPEIRNDQRSKCT